jgi:hypothetical protein
MKDFEEYRSKLPYPDRSAIRKEVTDEINNQPLTANDRADKLADVSRIVSEKFSVAVKPYSDDEKRLEAEFYKDCREDIGYDKYLHEDGCRILEGHAYQAGHSSGYSEVYGHLCDLSSLVSSLSEHLKASQ